MHPNDRQLHFVGVCWKSPCTN